MKKTIIIGLLILFSQNNNAQTIIPIEQYKAIWDADSGLPANSYVKDVNGVLDKFVGTWVGDYNNKTYHFFITKEINTFFDVKEDRLLIRYVIYSSGQIIVDTRAIPTGNDKVIHGFLYYPTRDGYLLNYAHNPGCGQIGQVFIRKAPFPDKIYLSLTLGFSMIDPATPCDSYEQTLLPTKKILLTKQ